MINYIYVDTLIVKRNMERYYSTNAIDMAYFRNLSNDIVSDIKKLAEDKDPNIASAAKELLEQRKKRLSEDSPWQSFNLANLRARKALEK